MPNFLAIDTSTNACSVALQLDNSDLFERHEVAAQQHTRRLLPMVDEVLQEGKLSLAELDGLICSHGPGSFTGLRIGLSVVQGLAYSQQLPVVMVSSLRLLAASAVRLLSPDENTVVMPTMDARMGDIYWGLYSSVNPSTSLLNDRVDKVEQVLQTPELLSREAQILGVGDGWACLQEHNIAVVDAVYPHAGDLFALAADAWQNQRTVSAAHVQPNYLREEIHWKKRQRIRPAEDK